MQYKLIGIQFGNTVFHANIQQNTENWYDQYRIEPCKIGVTDNLISGHRKTGRGGSSFPHPALVNVGHPDLGHNNRATMITNSIWVKLSGVILPLPYLIPADYTQSMGPVENVVDP